MYLNYIDLINVLWNTRSYSLLKIMRFICLSLYILSFFTLFFVWVIWFWTCRSTSFSRTNRPKDILYMPSTTYSFVFFCPTVKLRIRKHTNALAYGNEVNLNSANGPNKFLAILLKSCKNVLARLFQSLYQGFHTTFKLPT